LEQVVAEGAQLLGSERVFWGRTAEGGSSLKEPDEGTPVLFLFSRQTLDVAKGGGQRETPTPFLNLLNRPIRATPADNRHNALFVLSRRYQAVARFSGDPAAMNLAILPRGGEAAPSESQRIRFLLVFPRSFRFQSERMFDDGVSEEISTLDRADVLERISGTERGEDSSSRDVSSAKEGL